MPRRRVLAAIATAALAVSAAVWLSWPVGEEGTIRSRLDAFCTDVNAGTAEGLGTVTRAATIGAYFTDAATVDLGKGTAPITGRETIIGMAARLQPRTSAFRLKFDDVDVRLGAGRTAADVTLTASFIRRSIASGEESMDASEFRLAMAKEGGAWRIARVTAVETLK
jgi:SnoaL-like domain